ncbi:MAG TPA: FecR domain-containing protein [Polyangia bacterium]|jgi:TolA-binding protein|nr:FecR domain-containing protein [Polyangia bacterium]
MTGDRRASGAACAEVEELMLMGVATADTTTRLRVEGHLRRCAACQQVQAQLEQTAADVRLGATPLDDVRRARLLARLAPEFDETAARVAAARHHPGHDTRPLQMMLAWLRGWRGPAVGSVLAAGAVAWVLAVRGVPQAPLIPNPPPPIAAPVSRQSPAPPAPPAPAPALIEPYKIVGASGGPPPRQLLAHRFARLQTAAGTIVRARVGERTRMTLRGGADVAVVSAAQDVLDVRLDAGTLVADFDHQRTGRLRIHSPGAVTEVVGTLFAVEVQGQQSRVSVAHGRVVVQPNEGPPRILSSGQAWSSGTPAIARVSSQTAAFLTDHDVAIRPAPARPTPLAAAPSAPAPEDTRRVARLADLANEVADVAPPPEPPLPIPHAMPAPPAAPPVPVRPVLAAPAVAAPASPAVAGAERIYREAEAAMRRRDWSDAQRALEQVITAGAAGPLQDVARYELAQLALRAGDHNRAARWLDELLASDREPALREPARFLRCEVQARAGDATAARRCLDDFRDRYPGSSRDALALGWLIRLAPPDCAAVRRLADEYQRRYPDGTDATEARRRRAQCGP